MGQALAWPEVVQWLCGHSEAAAQRVKSALVAHLQTVEPLRRAGVCHTYDYSKCTGGRGGMLEVCLGFARFREYKDGNSAPESSQWLPLHAATVHAEHIEGSHMRLQFKQTLVRVEFHGLPSCETWHCRVPFVQQANFTGSVKQAIVRAKAQGPPGPMPEPHELGAQAQRFLDWLGVCVDFSQAPAS